MGRWSAGHTTDGARGAPRPPTRRTSALVVSTVLAGPLFVAALASPASAATLVAQWHMGDSTHTMLDASGAGRHGTSTSNVLLRQSGATGYGYRFTSTPSYVTVPSSSAFNPGTSAFSITAKVKYSTTPPGGDVDTYDILRKGFSSSSGGDYKLEITASGAAHCLFRGSSGLGEVTGSRSLADGRWHTLTCRRTSSKVTLVVDGAAKSSTKTTGTISNSTEVMLGAKNSSGHDQFKGSLDEVSVSRG